MDNGRTSGSEASLDEPRFRVSSPSSSESDETDGARKVPLLRGDLKGEIRIRSQVNGRTREGERVPLIPDWRGG